MIERIIAEVLNPGHFYVQGLELRWLPAQEEEIAWELFRGRLVDAAQTRARRRFRAWNILQLSDGAGAAEPLLSIKRDPATRGVHIVCAPPCYVWDGYD